MNDTIRPVTGIAANLDLNGSNQMVISTPPAYPDAVLRAGGVPLILPLTEERGILEKMCQVINGLLLPGGKDIDPHFYGKEPAESWVLWIGV